MASSNKSIIDTRTEPTLEQIKENLRKANTVALTVMKEGKHPFGAVLVAADHETVLLTQGNVNTVNHAESTLARRAVKEYTEDELWNCTLYTTVEPCVMCAGTQYWANIGRLVYGMSERQLLDCTGNHQENPTLDVPCRYVFDHGQKDIRVHGPIDDLPEIEEPHKTFWTKKA
jgi:tRNA(Arg) A34 adenosine deaminase TadA